MDLLAKSMISVVEWWDGLSVLPPLRCSCFSRVFRIWKSEPLGTCSFSSCLGVREHGSRPCAQKQRFGSERRSLGCKASVSVLHVCGEDLACSKMSVVSASLEILVLKKAYRYQAGG